MEGIQTSAAAGNQKLPAEERETIQLFLQAFENLKRLMKLKGIELPSDNCRHGLKRKLDCLDEFDIDAKQNIDNDYIFGEDLGKGNFGSVSLCKNKLTGDVFACKSIAKGNNIEPVRRELEMMTLLSGHPNVVNLQDVYEDQDTFQIVMELCSAGDLWQEMVKHNRVYTEQEAAYILKQIMLPIKHCHSMGVVHRDIKPQNILLTSSGCMKLADFGLATKIKGESISGAVGTPCYMAPEVALGKSYTEKVDVWSAGVLLYVLLTGTLPFNGSTQEQLLDQVRNLKIDFDSGALQNISASARDLIRKMMERDVSSRVTAEQVLTHPWILRHTSKNDATSSSKLVDAHTVALSQVKIYQPAKRRKLNCASCIPVTRNPIHQNLCRAY
ncbi:non-specific serine/threonine protein kinase [Ranunculus cassubicifolius]